MQAMNQRVDASGRRMVMSGSAALVASSVCTRAMNTRVINTPARIARVMNAESMNTHSMGTGSVNAELMNIGSVNGRALNTRAMNTRTTGTRATNAGMPLVRESVSSQSRGMSAGWTGRFMLRRVVMLLCAGALVWSGWNVAMPHRAESATGAIPVVNYTVQPGDTLWSYARQVTPRGASVTDTVDELMELNNFESASLQPGQTILVPERA